MSDVHVTVEGTVLPPVEKEQNVIICMRGENLHFHLPPGEIKMIRTNLRTGAWVTITDDAGVTRDINPAYVKYVLIPEPS